MTKARDKRKFIIDLMDSIKRDLVTKVESMPEEWDGHELRQLIADKAAWGSVGNSPMTGSRMKNYRNVVLARNL